MSKLIYTGKTKDVFENPDLSIPARPKMCLKTQMAPLPSS